MCYITIKKKKMNGLTNHVLMVRPYHFKKNDQTALNNYYQSDIGLDFSTINKLAISEFDEFVKVLIDNGINVIVHQDNKKPETPDSLFPNNWISFHHRHKVIIYPMFAENRRDERSSHVFDTLKKSGVNTKVIFDLTNYENLNIFFEGTGSMVLDRVNKKLYASLSDRTHDSLILDFCKKMNYKPIIFSSFQTVNNKRLEIYHTNVMMSVGDKFAAVGLDSIDDVTERNMVLNELKNDNKEIISLTENQIEQFAGNMLLLKNNIQPILVMSTSAFKSLSKDQIIRFETYAKIVHSNLDTIEKAGGGSARCMLAEIF